MPKKSHTFLQSSTTILLSIIIMIGAVYLPFSPHEKSVTENNQDSTDFILMRERWLRGIIGDRTLNVNDPDIQKYIQKVTSDAESLWKTLNKHKDRTYLWEPRPSDTTSAEYTTQFNNIRTLAVAFGLKGSSLYENEELYEDIVDALDFMTIDKKYDGSYSTGNWWNWQIGSAQPFVDIVMITSEYMSEDQVDKYVKCISGYASDPSVRWGGDKATGANLTDIGLSVLGSAILTKDTKKMELVKDKLPIVMNVVTNGDGFYADGSFIQHGAVAYTGSYGNELIKGIGRILSITAGTKWEINDPSITNVYQAIESGFLPFMHNGKMMSMMNGRSISRAPGTNPFTTELATGRETIANIMRIATFAPAKYKSKYESVIKSWLIDSKEYQEFYEEATSLEVVQNAKDIMNNPSISSAIPSSGMKVYGAMDRVLQVTPNYSAGISMYSSRTYNFESFNTENTRGWHTGDGMFYLYNNDETQFGEGYWPTVDSVRLPGTTVDTVDLPPGQTQGKPSPQSWVGGVTDGEFGAVGMYLDKSNLGIPMNVRAKKSWFMLDGAIVALGSSISGTTTSSIESIIENRLLNNEGSNLVLVNGKTQGGAQKEVELSPNSWVHLEGNKKGTDIGYYFPTETTINLEKETRSGTYKDINGYFQSDAVYNKSYFKMLINHGQDVSNQTYQYVLLPGKTEEETKEFAKKSHIKIIENSDKVQAVEDTQNAVMVMNVWKEGFTTVNGLTVSQPSSIMMTITNGKLTIAVADPKQQNTKINVKVDLPYREIISKDDSIEVVNKNETSSIEFVVDTTGAAGSSRMISFDVSKN
ncbi:polysaccharide lyase 8 family protein [Rossellomorea aquimaris]|uniref:polysaccharide lyase 8 family protein n=1 Tax=Rossellomorea aquimaris TaxID=189382 RepID=UPI001CD60908|nr:polysaccharide lyase 8 family protein [Rossellomorea aquimaris]MCA1060839.1 polysaccharide lyase 8 family protein [Rossellomorea aquimaris]